MSATRFSRPRPGEYSPYFDRYLEPLPDGDVLALLRLQGEQTSARLLGVPAALGAHRYAPGKWSVRQVIGHIVDTERVFTYRALRFSRGDATPLPGFEQDDYVENGGFDDRAVTDLVKEFQAVRAASIALFEGMSQEMLGRRGIASGAELTVRAIPWIVAGHERHHVAILEERYLAGARHDG
jgi:uncharacterized damage-inducible protein DinB